MKRFLPALLPVLMLAGCASQPVTPADKAAFINVSDLSIFGYDQTKIPAGTWNKTAYGDGTYDVDYEVETPDSEEKDPLYLNETLSDEKKSSDALTYLAAARGTLNLSLKSQGLTETSVPNQTVYGDGSNLTILKKDNIAVGNIFSARKKGRTFSLMMVGPLCETPADWELFAGKKVRAWLDGAK